jgi:hypothetical protein
MTLDDAIAAGARGELADWVDAFLRGPGNNVELADGLLRAPRWWRGPIELPLAQLIRLVGPEPGMEYFEAAESWARRVDAMVDSLARGWQPPPLIAWYRGGQLTVQDGGHRLAALARGGRERAWTIIWFDRERDYMAQRTTAIVASISHSK